MTMDAEIQALEVRVVRTEDLSGLRCPLPILCTKKALAGMAAGEVLKVITTDSAAVEDLAVFCQQTGHRLLAQVAGESSVAHWIARKD